MHTKQSANNIPGNAANVGKPPGEPGGRPFQAPQVEAGSFVSDGEIQEIVATTGLSREQVVRDCWMSGGKTEPVTAIVLNGGRSSRMGADKSSLKVNGQTLLNRTCGALSEQFDEVLVSCADSVFSVPPGVRLVRDVTDGCGPLMGIRSALEQASNQLTFVVACDIPQIHMPTVRQLLSFAPFYDCVLPSLSTDTIEPLFAVYNRSVWSTAERLLIEGERKIRSILPHCRTKIVPLDNADWYFNLNTPREYQRFIEKDASNVRCV